MIEKRVEIFWFLHEKFGLERTNVPASETFQDAMDVALKCFKMNKI